MGMSFAHLLLLLAPVLDANRLVGLHHICDLELRIHLSEEEEEEAENIYEIMRGVFYVCVCVCEGRYDKWRFDGIL